MIVVTDTSVILNLCLIGREELLPALFGTIVAPSDVVFEFDRLAEADGRFHNLVFPSFVERSATGPIAPSLTAIKRLQAGEIAALSLAVHLKADAVLMDELAGRAAAVALGLRPIGLLGILLEAKERGLISALKPLLDRLEDEAEFWISASLRNAILNSAGEIR